MRGNKNPFYGKNHTAEIIEKLKNSAKKGENNHNYDKTLYKFVNTITNEIFEGTRHQFYTKYSFDRRCVKRIIKGKRQSYKGWKLSK